MVRKNTIHHIDSVIEETTKLLNKKRGIVAASIEYALPLGEETVIRVKEAIKKRTRAARVDLSGQLRPELIGGYRLKIGDELIDASISSQLKKLENRLAAGVGGMEEING
jgi:F-type H+-transporting ATPase subunit delta